MTPQMVIAQSDTIREMHRGGNLTTEIHKHLQRDGLRLGDRGKQKVRTITTGYDREQTFAAGGANNAQQLLLQLQSEGCWMRFTLDEDGRINRIAWALDEQRTLALRYYHLVIQDNTFNSNKYSYFLALIVVVDKDNYTHIAMQALLSSERTEDFDFLFRSFRELIEGAQPQVIFTDADAAAMAAIDRQNPSSRHQLCRYHMIENMRKHGKGLAEGVLAAVIKKFNVAAFAQTEERFLKAKQDLFSLLRADSHMYTYMAESVFGPKWVHRWAKYWHPGLPPLGITSMQRVESTNSALKPALSRSATMVAVHGVIKAKVKDDANKTARQNTGGAIQRVRIPTQSQFEKVKKNWPGHFDYVRDCMQDAKCSAFAMKDMSDEALAAMGYNAKPLAMGNDDVQRLLADFVANPAGAGLLYDTTSGEGVDVTLTTRTSMKFFVELLRGQALEQRVRVNNMYGTQTQYCHLVALGSGGFFLCTCLRILTVGLGCRHALRAMHHAGLGFNGACIAPRWRDGTMDWTMGPLAAKPAVLGTTGMGLPGEVPPPPSDPSAFSRSKATVRASGYASCCAFGKEMAAITSRIDNIPTINRVLENLKNQARQLVEVEVRSQHNASTSRVFTGVVPTPPTAPEPLGGGDSSEEQGGGTGRRGANGRVGRGSAGNDGRAGIVVSTAGMPSPGGLPALQPAQAAGASAAGLGGGGGGAGVSAVGMPSPGVGLPATDIRAATGAPPFQPLSNTPRRPVGQPAPCLAPTGFDAASLGGMCCTDNHGNPLPPTPPMLAVLDDVQSPQR